MAVQQNIAGATSGNNVRLGGTPSGQVSTMVLDVYSQEIMFRAQPVLRFESVAQAKTDLSVAPGGRIAFLTYNAMTGPSAIAETSTIETEAMSTAIRYISVTEHARAIGVSELLLQQAVTDILMDAAMILGMHFARSRDQYIRDALYTTTNVLYAGVVGDTVPYQNATRAAINTGDTLSIGFLRGAIEQLATSKAPKFGGDAYVCFVHPHQAVALRGDAGWLSVVQYGDPTRVYNGEIGRIEDIRFIESTMIQYIKANANQSSTVSQVWTDSAQEFARDGTTSIDIAVGAGNVNVDVYRALIVGDNAVGVADALPVEMRDNGVEDFGRKHSLAYYAIYGAGLIEGAHSIILETA